MKRKNLTLRNTKPVARSSAISSKNPQTLKVLEEAWNNLPTDMTLEEREVFFEVSEQIIKLHNKTRRYFEDQN